MTNPATTQSATPSGNDPARGPDLVLSKSLSLARACGDLSAYALQDLPYLDLLARILEHGARRTDRTGTGTLSLFGAQIRFDLRRGFPLLTTKKMSIVPVVRELLWFLRGSTNVRDDLGAKIWDEWAGPDGDLGPIYGQQWRNWGGPRLFGTAGEDGIPRPGWSVGGEAAGHQAGGIDQIREALRMIRETPDSRRILVSAWNVSEIPRMHLPPCHALFQFYVDDGFLDCQLYQRSADMALGVPFNIASYALLLAMFAAECRLVPRYFVHTFGDAHVYLNHVDGAREQLAREPWASPRLVLAEKPVLAQTFSDVQIVDYQSHPAISFQVSV